MMNHLPRVLLLENSPFRRYAYGRLLRLKGYEVREATDAAEALDSLNEFPADLVLSDLSLPDMAPDELIERIRSNPETARVAVVSITERLEPESVDRSSRPENRPVDLPGLLERLRSFAPSAAAV